MKLCSTCKQEKPYEAFAKRLDGFAYMCRSCCSEYNKAVQQLKTPEQKDIARKARSARYQVKKSEILEKGSAYYKANREPLLKKMRSYYAANKGVWKAWHIENPGYDTARVSKRRAAILKATPVWAQANEIQEVYAFAKEFRDSGIPVHVDHIFPLRGKTVCGLHVEQNLRVCLAEVNAKKGNKTWSHI